MNIQSKFQDKLKRRPPFCIISNLSYTEGQVNTKILLSTNRLFDKIRIQNIQDEWIPNHSEFMNTWGTLFIFNRNSPSIHRHHFFDKIIHNQIPILTLYIDLSAANIPSKMKDMYIRIGKSMTSAQLSEFNSGAELEHYLRNKLQILELARQSHLKMESLTHQQVKHFPTWSQIKTELNTIERKGGLLQIRGKFRLYLTSFKDLVYIPHSIGYLRTKTYSEVGEGSEREIDLDAFDEEYKQLFLVDSEAQQIVGGYRIGPCKKILRSIGIEGLYMHELYEIDEDIYPMLQKSIELGRSFVVRDYQKKQLPLFILWNGILTYLQQNPHYRYIFGMVSISRAYSDVSRNLITLYLKQHHFNDTVAQYFKPRQAYYTSSSLEKLETIIDVLNGDLIRLDELISEIEPHQYRLPVLIRKYLNQNAHFIGFNIDPAFSDCVDGLMFLDINDIPVRTLQLLRER